jgi:hypothetical protein
MLAAVMAALVLGAVMSLGDVIWAAMRLQHRAIYGIVHGAVMCLCLGIAVGMRVRRPIAGALAGPVIGVIAAVAFYGLVRWLGLAAMFPAWMLFWILFALLQRQLSPHETLTQAAIRGLIAAMLSGLAFYEISGIWTRPSPGGPNVLIHLAAWSVAFFPGFLVLFWRRGTRRAR